MAGRSAVRTSRQMPSGGFGQESERTGGFFFVGGVGDLAESPNHVNGQGDGDGKIG
jgi:hypothetical protein